MQPGRDTRIKGVCCERGNRCAGSQTIQPMEKQLQTPIADLMVSVRNLKQCQSVQSAFRHFFTQRSVYSPGGKLLTSSKRLHQGVRVFSPFILRMDANWMWAFTSQCRSNGVCFQVALREVSDSMILRIISPLLQYF